MKLTRDGRLVRDDIWREGKYLDLWSVVHFLSGISFGLGMYYVHLGTAASIVIVLISLIAYELWEALVKIEETPQNRILDVVVGMVSFLPTFLLVAPHLSRTTLVTSFACVFILNVMFSTLGWLESRKASALETKMRAEYELNRVRMLARRDKLRARLEERRKRKAEQGMP